MALAVQEACKHFFLANYNHCAELRDCEDLDPKLLCELMRLHNSRASAMQPGVPQAVRPSGAGGNGTGQGTAVSNSPATIATAAAATAAAAATGSASPGNAPPSMLSPLSPSPPPREDTSARQCPAHSNSLPPVPIPPETLAEDLKKLILGEGITSPDFEIVVQDEVIHCHKFILAARSRYFASCILTSGMVEAQDSRLVIPANSAMTADAFRAFLRFVYAGDDILGTLVPHTAMYLVEASSFYGLTNSRLKHFCELCVKDSFNEAHVLQLFEASSRLNVEAVRTMALDFIISQFSTVGRQPALEQLDKSLLLEILKGLAERLPPSPGTTSPGLPQSLG
eukprot:gnl/TRDRNA2_/TRDRNA2_160472_c0_seq1.p1 gnl/TRDRNA2_/TRDRNA2_160472_c0~~gnl/TRDRNA2_/TRDRNA2_160472_c0_seq1.p1  ORF type:complete len:389 (+),score=80.92 gnl/TRDRNA2_/TRDRNA2_160472_c0_seq1:152-1168(+)